MSICTLRTVARCSGSIEPVCSHCSSPDATIAPGFPDLQFALESHRYTPHHSLLQYPLVISLEKTEGLTATAPLPLGGSPKEKKTRPDPAPSNLRTRVKSQR